MLAPYQTKRRILRPLPNNMVNGGDGIGAFGIDNDLLAGTNFIEIEGIIFRKRKSLSEWTHLFRNLVCACYQCVYKSNCKVSL